MTVEAERRYTPEDLLHHSAMKHYELVDGGLVEKGSGAVTGWITAQLCARLAGYADRSGLAWVFPSTTGYSCFAANPDRVRKPDVSLVKRRRLPRIPQGHISISPDLAVEVISPNEASGDVQLKVEEFLTAGVPTVWVLDPEAQTVSVHQPRGRARKLQAHEALNGGDLLPGFRCMVAELFPPVEVAERFGRENEA